MTIAPAAGPTKPHEQPMTAGQFWLRILIVFGLLFIFLSGITGLGSGFKMLGKEALASFFQAAENPFVGLTVGILGTTLAQSSSVTTSMIVAMVAGGTLSVEQAVPMVMGANIGTTVTNTIVSLGHITRPEEFRRAFAAATCHDFFNFIAVAILLPLEMATGMLQKTASVIAVAIAGTSGGKFPNPVKDATKAIIKPIKEALQSIFDGDQAVAIALIIVSMIIIFVTLGFIVKTLRVVASERMESIVAKSLGRSVYLGLLVGIIVTIMVQSSSITTSIMVPLAGAGLIQLEQVFPITVGSNIGTTITALLASLAAPAATLHLALTIALVHLLFNVAGVLLIFAIPPVRRVPLRCARWLADLAVKSRRYALLYVVLLFYGLPALMVFVSRLF